MIFSKRREFCKTIFGFHPIEGYVCRKLDEGVKEGFETLRLGGLLLLKPLCWGRLIWIKEQELSPCEKEEHLEQTLDFQL